MNNVIDINGLKKSYSNGENPLKVLDGLNLRLENGASLAIEGESGSGKSTLLRIIGALDVAFEGNVSVCGKNLKELSLSEAADFRSSKIGFVFQKHFFLPQFTVFENVMLPSINRKDDVSQRAYSLLESGGILKLKDRFPSEISGGELQRAAVARALINSPQLLIADEPTGALDRKNADILMEFLADLNRGGLSIITATHSDRLAKSMSQTCRLIDGFLNC